jgi:hypothetical protein
LKAAGLVVMLVGNCSSEYKVAMISLIHFVFVSSWLPLRLVIFATLLGPGSVSAQLITTFGVGSKADGPDSTAFTDDVFCRRKGIGKGSTRDERLPCVFSEERKSFSCEIRIVAQWIRD